MVLAWVAVLVWLSVPRLEIATAQGLSNNSDSGQQLFCSRDFGNFLANGIDFDGEGFTDYWNDILVVYNNNYCQFSDIDSLLNRIDKARKQIRQAFYVCDATNADKIKAQYYEMSAELYYLRHFVNTSPSPNPKDSQAEKEQKVALNPDVKGAFISRFVNAGYFDNATANTLYNKFKAKYENKLEAYRNCSDPNLDALRLKIADLQNTFKVIENLGKKFAERSKKRWTAMEKRIAANPGLLTALSADSAGDFFGRIVGAQVNGAPVQEATIWEDISGTAKENAPFYYGDTKTYPPVINQQLLYGDITKVQKRSANYGSEQGYVAAYDLKYRQIRDSGLDQMIVSLNELQTIVKDTYGPLDKIRVCTANIVSKQCGG